VTRADVPEPLLEAAASLLARKVGLRSDAAIRGRLAHSLVEEAAAGGLDLPAYLARLERQPTVLQGLLDRVTVQETSFFRDPGQFAALRETVLSGLGPAVTVWSAGCSTGQEPYSLAMEVTDSAIPDWRIIATDISTLALERTRRARYADREMSGVSAAGRRRHFVAAEAPTEWDVAAELRGRVEVVQHNLVASPPPFEPGECDVVFCRNVLIYLRQDDVQAFLTRLAQWLRPGAWLFVGSAETLWPIVGAFELVRVGGAFAYRRTALDRPGPVDRAELGAAPPAPPVTADPWRPPPDPRRAQVTAAPVSGLSHLLAEGESALRAGDHGTAVKAFRKCAYLDPDHLIARLHLGLALEAAGDDIAARGAFGAARTVLERSEPGTIEAALKGYQGADLMRLLDAKLKPEPRGS